MVPIKIEKFQAMKSSIYKRKIQQLLQSLINFLLTTLLLGLFLSSPLWLPPMFSFLMLLKAKSLFFACNAIVAVLLAMSKLSRSSSPNSPGIYEEYVNRHKSLQRASGGSEGMEREGEQEEESFWSEEEKDLDELNRRVEDFIAKVNKQRRIEARMMASNCGGKKGGI